MLWFNVGEKHKQDLDCQIHVDSRLQFTETCNDTTVKTASKFTHTTIKRNDKTIGLTTIKR